MRKIFFFLDTNHIGKIPIPVVVTSSVMAEWLRLGDASVLLSNTSSGSGGEYTRSATPSHSDALKNNWFAASNALRVYRQVRLYASSMTPGSR